ARGARGPPAHCLCRPPPALLPYVPRVPPRALPGKVTATTFALEMPCCVFEGDTNASDAVWLVVAFANASDTFKNPPTRADVPPYEQLPTAHSYMTLETVASAYSCSASSTAILRVGGDTACGGQGGRDPCNGPLPSPGPYRRVKDLKRLLFFLKSRGLPRRKVVGTGGGWQSPPSPQTPLDASASLSLQRRGVGVPVPPGFGDQRLRPQVLQDPPHPPSPAPAPAPRLQVQPPGAGLLRPPTSRSLSWQVNSPFTSTTASSFCPAVGRCPPPAATPLSATQGWSHGGHRHWDPQNPPGSWLGGIWCQGGTRQHQWGLQGAARWASPWGSPLPTALLPG
uniref:Uroplakin 3B n=1 Tax=Calidris pygmaea TaxID=425635 RepID=A0A8C3PTI3_9CHAR